MKIPKVSIIIPAYNAEQFIDKTLDSVFNQSYQDFEVIVVDDGSCDGTGKVISKYKDRLTYILKENQGLSLARNTGIAVARGEYIAFLDHDDIWLPERLKVGLTLLEEDRGLYLCFSDAYIIDKKGRRRNNTLFEIYRPHRGMVFRELLKENFIPIITAVVRKDIFKEIGLFNPQYKIVEDWDFFLRMSRRYPMTFINQPLAEYRIHEGSFSRRKDIALTESVNIIDKNINFVDKITTNMLKKKKQRFQFDLGILYLQRGMKIKARDYFFVKLKEMSFCLYFYLGFLVTCLPCSYTNFIGKFLFSRGQHDI